MSTESWLVTAVIVIGLALGVWLACQAWKRHAEPADYFGDVRAATPLPRVRVPELHEDTGRLPTLGERTMMLRALRDMCALCGTDHTGDCETEAITGTIVAVAVDSPDDWTWNGSKLSPPQSLMEQLPDGDWLRALLLVSA